MSEKSILEQMREEARRIEKNAEYEAKRDRTRKPRAVRKFERFSNMGEDRDTKNNKKGT